MRHLHTLYFFNEDEFFFSSKALGIIFSAKPILFWRVKIFLGFAKGSERRSNDDVDTHTWNIGVIFS